jgi:hypothetical protein
MSRKDLGQEKEREQALAQTLLRPSVQAALSIKSLAPDSDQLDLVSLINELSELVQLSNDGDSSRVEAILLAQSQTLDVLFNTLLVKGVSSETINHQESYLKLALKAQGQARTTIEALGRIRNPPVSNYLEQTNIAQGPQQVNNGIGGESTASKPVETELETNFEEEQVSELHLENKLLDQKHAERMDTGKKSEAGRNDTAVEALEKINRPSKRCRKV